MIKKLSSFAWAVMALLATPVVLAQSYPNKAIRIIVPFAAGASNDIVARLIAPRLSEGLGQTVAALTRLRQQQPSQHLRAEGEVLHVHRLFRIVTAVRVAYEDHSARNASGGEVLSVVSGAARNLHHRYR